jgi:hypothetical protein
VWFGLAGLTTSCAASRPVATARPESVAPTLIDAEAGEPISEYLDAVGRRDLHRMRDMLDLDSPSRRLVRSPYLEKSFDTADFRVTGLERIGDVDGFVVCIFAYDEVLHYGDDVERVQGCSIAILRRRDSGLRMWRESRIRDWDGRTPGVTPASGDDTGRVSPHSAEVESLKRTLGQRLSAEMKGDPDEAERVSCSDAARMPFFCAVAVDGGFAGRWMDSGRVLASFDLVACGGDLALCRSKCLRAPRADGSRSEVDDLILFHRHRGEWKIAKEIQLDSRDVE